MNYVKGNSDYAQQICLRVLQSADAFLVKVAQRPIVFLSCFLFCLFANPKGGVSINELMFKYRNKVGSSGASRVSQNHYIHFCKCALTPHTHPFVARNAHTALCFPCPFVLIQWHILTGAQSSHLLRASSFLQQVAQTFDLACTEVRPLFINSERVRRVRKEGKTEIKIKKINVSAGKRNI